jgi:hypothetical protein
MSAWSQLSTCTCSCESPCRVCQPWQPQPRRRASLPLPPWRATHPCAFARYPSRSCASERAHAHAWTRAHVSCSPTFDSRCVAIAAPPRRRSSRDPNLAAPESRTKVAPFLCLANLWATHTSPGGVLTSHHRPSPLARPCRAAAPMGLCVEHHGAIPEIQGGVPLHKRGHTWIWPQPIHWIPCTRPLPARPHVRTHGAAPQRSAQGSTVPCHTGRSAGHNVGLRRLKAACVATTRAAAASK